MGCKIFAAHILEVPSKFQHGLHIQIAAHIYKCDGENYVTLHCSPCISDTYMASVKNIWAATTSVLQPMYLRHFINFTIAAHVCWPLPCSPWSPLHVTNTKKSLPAVRSKKRRKILFFFSEPSGNPDLGLS